MPSSATNEATRQEWRELGFFDDQHVDTKEWRLIGSMHGLLGFARMINAYALHPDAERPSEHFHLGPYGYLKIATWNEPQITSHWIAGTTKDLIRLAMLINSALADARVGDVLKFRSKFAPTSPFDLSMEIRDTSFDPAAEDASCWHRGQ